MKNAILYILIFTLGIVVLSCNVNKDLRKQERCNKKLEKLVERCPNLLNNDTIIDTIRVEVPKIEIKDSLTVRVDTLELLKYITKEQIKYVVKSIQIDTLIVDSLYRLQISLSNGVLTYNVEIYQRTILKPTETITQSVTIDKLTWFESVRLYWGKWFKWLIILTVIFGLLWIFNKIFNPFKK